MGLSASEPSRFFFENILEPTFMYLCYIDESGTSDIPGNTSHFVLLALCIPIYHWRTCDKDIEAIKGKYQLENTEIHAGWILRPYPEQNIPGFDKLDYAQRKARSLQWRTAELLRLQRTKNHKQYQQTKKNLKNTEPYAHLTYAERLQFAEEIAQCISKWGFARLFAECVDKTFFDPLRTLKTIDEQSFEQIVSRFEQFLHLMSSTDPTPPVYGLLIHDNNTTIAKKYTNLMRLFHKQGTMWTSVKCIIETPLFVDSQLTSMVQVADLCAYATRRYLENGEDKLFDLIFKRADQKDGIVVGVRHFTRPGCNCKICTAHKSGIGTQARLPIS
jgi:hypothetical protein